MATQLYTGPITVSVSQTIKAVALAPGKTVSDELVAAYVIGVLPITANLFADWEADNYSGGSLPDTSGNSHTLSGTATLVPNTYNGHGELQFNGSSDHLSVSGFALPLGARSVYIVCREITSVSNAGFLCVYNSGGTGNDFDDASSAAYDSSVSPICFSVDSDNNAVQETAVKPTAITYRTAIFGGGTATLYSGGSLVGTHGGSENGTTTNALLGARFLSGAIAAPFLHGGITRILVYSVAHGSADQSAIESYIKSRYGF